MLNNYINSVITSELPFKPTSEQEILVAKLTDFIQTDNSDTIFLLKGFAGTGKTTVVSAFVKALEKLQIKNILMAPTGRAAKVFSHYSKKQAFTIHKRIYRQKNEIDGMGVFAIDKNLTKNTVFIVDEASMIANSTSDLSGFGSGRLLNDLIDYVFSGTQCKLILLGDEAQLPPVGSFLSPALNKSELELFGKDIIEVNLRQIVRQSAKSGVLFNATKIRNQIPEFVNKVLLPRFELKSFTDIERINGQEIIDAITHAYDTCGQEETLIITRSNQLANRYNTGIRKSILWRDEEIAQGDLLMIVKNNYFWTQKIENIDFIANGDIAKVNTIHKYENLYNLRFAEVTLSFPDYEDLKIRCKILLDTLNLNTPSLDSEQNRKFYQAVSEDYSDIKSKRDVYKQIKENPYFNAMQVKFAYAVTCHKAQGGQWDTVFVDQGYFTDDMLNVEYLRWLYTAFTRAVKKLYLVNFKDEYFLSKRNK